VAADVLKVVLAPVFVVAITLVARRFGSRIGGVVGGLPAIAGPILFVLALDHGRSFTADAAVGTLLGVVAVMAFLLGYVAVSGRFGWPAAVAVGWACFLAVVGALKPVHVDAYVALVVACAATAGTVLLLPRPRVSARVDGPHPPRELAVRALCAVLPVVAVTASAHLLGPHLSGLLASFPIMTPVLAAFTQARLGAREAAHLLHGLAAGFFAYALFCFVVAVTLEPWGIAPSFGLGLLVAFTVQAAAVALTGRHERALALEAVG
jgi:hypothetical protein